MAKQIQFQVEYTGQGYLDSKTSVSSISELINKWDFEGQSVSMPNAFVGKNGIPYPIDFWLTPFGEIDKWEIKSLPALESEEDFILFENFISEFKEKAGYFPVANGVEILVDGVKFNATLNANKLEWVDNQAIFDETIEDTIETAVAEAVKKITSGASESFDTFKEIEEWIKNNSGNTIVDLKDYATLEKVKEYISSAITLSEKNMQWLPVDENAEKHIVRHWRGSREKYEFLVKNNAIDSWTRYVVIDNNNGHEVITEYYGTNQVTELTGQLLPAKSIISDISNITPAPYDRYLVGSDGKGYNIYEYVIDSENQYRWLIKPFDYRFGIRIKDKGFKNYIYVNGELITYDEVNCGIF